MSLCLSLEVDKLQAEVKNATIELDQIERQLIQSSSTRAPKRLAAPALHREEKSDNSSPAVDGQRGSTASREFAAEAPGTGSQPWYKLQAIRVQLNMLLEDLERSRSDDGSNTVDERLLRSACWQLLDEEPRHANYPEGVSKLELGALEMASFAVALELTWYPGLAHELERSFADEVCTQAACAEVRACSDDFIAYGGLYERHYLLPSCSTGSSFAPLSTCCYTRDAHLSVFLPNASLWYPCRKMRCL